MWKLLFAIGLLCGGCDSRDYGQDQLTCKNPAGQTVDWYVLYKMPQKLGQLGRLTGLEYYYADPTHIWNEGAMYDPINANDGILAHTLKPLFDFHRNLLNNVLTSDFGYISYSDQAPGVIAHQIFGHSKGVVMMNMNKNSGVWLMHSTPQFPFHNDINTFWPPTGTVFAQNFICVTFPYAAFQKIGKHLQQIRAYPFNHHIPGNFHQSLQDVTKRVDPNPTARNYVLDQALQSAGGQLFRSFAKYSTAKINVQDLYADILAQKLQRTILAQTWGRQRDRLGPFCTPGLFHVHNVMSILEIASNNQWLSTQDHSKWCVADPDLVCIADLNRAESQSQRPGGALLFANKKLSDALYEMVANQEHCPNLKWPDHLSFL